MTQRLQKGESISINTLNDLVIATEWQNKTTIPSLEMDVSAFLLTDNKVSSDADFIFYNQPSSLNNAVLLKNRRFKVNLKQLAPDINRIAFVLSIYQAQQRKHNFSLANDIYIRIFDFSTRSELISFQLNDAHKETTVILATLYLHQNTWKFRAMGQGYEFDLSVLAKNFGVDIESESTPSPAPLELSPDTPPANTLVNWIKHKFIAPSKTINNQNPIHAHPNLLPEKTKLFKSASKSKESTLADSINIHDTHALTLQSQYEAITFWFKRKGIPIQVNPDAMDTTGFFDEVAVALGDNYPILKTVSHKIKNRQLNNKDRAYIELIDIAQNDSNAIQKFCKDLYEYSFVEKYFFNQQKKLITLQLQSATRIVHFFNGEWLEWYAFMKIVDYCHQRQLPFSCSRNMRIDTINGHYEIDVFFLINNTPLFIECKSGEYRPFIDKYCKLRKQLNISKPYFLFLVADMNETKTKGLTAMFDITFINAHQLNDYLQKII